MSKNFLRRGLPRKQAQEDEYHVYVFSKKEWVLYIAEGLALTGIFAYFFYRSIVAFVCLTPIAWFFLQSKKKDLAAKKRQTLQVQFKDAVLSVSANQKAGYSVENAFRKAAQDMEMLYGRDSPICKELALIMKGLDNNVVLEQLLYRLGVKSGVSDIMQFAEVFAIAKRNGGNMTDILGKTAETIEEKIAVDREIQVLVSSKKMEQNVMNLIPFFIILYISLTSKGFFDSLYHNLTGVAIMSACLAVYIAAYMISGKLVAIQV